MSTSNVLRKALRAAVVSLLAYWAGFHFTRLVQGSESQIGALWATISGVVVLLATRRGVCEDVPTLDRQVSLGCAVDEELGPTRFQGLIGRKSEGSPY